MGLQKKVLLVFVLAMGGISAATYGVSYVVISKNFERLEERIVRANLTRISNAVAHQQQHLDSVANDWANWNSTYEFMWGRDPDYTEAEVSDETFNQYEINLLMLLDVSGRVALCRSFGRGQSVCRDEKQRGYMVQIARDLTGNRADGTVSGLITVGGQPMQVSMRPILRTDLSGPSRGTLIMARWMDEGQLLEIARMLALPMTAVVESASDVRSSSVDAVSPWGMEREWVKVLGRDRIAGFVRIDDVVGAPGLVLTTEFRRDLLHEGRAAQWWFFGQIVMITVLLSFSGLLMLQRLVLSRVARLGAMANSISSTGDLSQRISISGNDEISIVETAFNSMLQEMEEARRELLIAQETLEYNASHDGLTGVLNRAATMQQLKAEISRSLRGSGPIGVLLLDLDYFKAVNDKYGHAAGDEVLRSVTEAARSTLRPYDMIGRYGGEEFLVIVPDCAEQEAMTVAERLRRSVEVSAGHVLVTVSIGVTVGDGKTAAAQLLSAADAALYRAKQGGRNRVEFCRPKMLKGTPELG